MWMGRCRHGQRLAEFLDRVMYVCPACGLSEFYSEGDIISCKQCGKQIRYLPSKEFSGDFPFRFVNDWYEYQKDYVNQLDTQDYTAAPMYEETADIYRVIPYQRKELLDQGAGIALFGDRLVMGLRSLPFEEISTMAVLGRNKLNIYHKDGLFQLKGDKRFNALKYVQLFYRSKNIAKGDIDGKFLGL